jgi:two-component system NarL family sensor kinase
MPRLANRRLQQAIEGERKRIANDLHDGLGQSLTTVKLRVENALIKLGKGEKQESAMMLTDVVRQLQNAIGEVRRIATELRPSMLDDLGLMPTLRWLARQFNEAHEGISLHLDISVAEADIPQEIKTIVYRLVQEALTNVSKHSNAGSVFIYLRNPSGGFKVGIVDNGVGFDSTRVMSAQYCFTGNGINSMRERVEVSGGQFKIRSLENSGTAVTAVWGGGENAAQTDWGMLDSNAPYNTQRMPLDVDLSTPDWDI